MPTTTVYLIQGWFDTMTSLTSTDQFPNFPTTQRYVTHFVALIGEVYLIASQGILVRARWYCALGNQQ